MPQKQTKTVHEGETITIKPKAKNREPVTLRVGHAVMPDLVEDQVGGFVNFLREYAVVGLAVGIVVGSQVTSIVKQMITSFFDPLSVLLFGAPLSGRTFTWHLNGRHADFDWGTFTYTMINFLFVLVALYAIIKIFHLDQIIKANKTGKKK